MKHFLVLILLLQTPVSQAAFERANQGSRAAAMGGSLVALKADAWSAFANPAALQTVPERTLSLFYVPQPFGLKELARGAAAYVEPTRIGAFGLSVSNFGFELYRETQVALSFSREFTPGMSGGATVNYYTLGIQNYGSAATFGIDLGLLLDISDEVRWGIVAFNLNAPSIGEAKEKLPQVFASGITYDPISEVVIAASIEKDIRFPAALHVGVEYSILGIIAVRAGTTSDPSTLNAGIGIAYAFLQLDYALTSHAELGITHQFSLSLALGDF